MKEQKNFPFFLLKCTALDLRLFQDDLSGLIARTASAVVKNDLNSGNAKVEGLETQLQWNIGTQTRLIYGFSHIQITSDNQYKMTYSTVAPKNSQSLMLTHRFDHRWSASLMGYQTGATHFPGTDNGTMDNPRAFIDSNRRWDARLAYRFRTGASDGELAVVMQNLADSHYFEYRHDNELPGRSAWLQLKLEI